MTLNILKLAREILVEPNLFFYDSKNQVADLLWKSEFEHWQTDNLAISLFNNSDKEYSFLAFNKILLINEELGELNEANLNPKKFLKIANTYVKTIPKTQLKRLGIRVMAYIDLEYTFQELVNKLKPKLYPSSDSPIYTITNNDYEDIYYATVFNKKDFKMRLQLGPVTSDELISRTQLKYAIEKDSLPKASLFFDLDTYILNPRFETLEKTIESFNKEMLLVLNEMTRFLNS